jgi:hypothetical protein
MAGTSPAMTELKDQHRLRLRELDAMTADLSPRDEV